MINQKDYDMAAFFTYIERFPIEIYTPVYAVQFNLPCDSCNKTEQVIALVVSGIEYENFIIKDDLYILQFVFDLPNDIRHTLYNYPTWGLNIKHNFYLNHCLNCKSLFLDFDIYNGLLKTDIKELQVTKLKLSKKSYYAKTSYSIFPRSKYIFRGLNENSQP
ncbi:MAG TPA: hypothetical protein PK564_01280 [bacterium]|nr:hypothetical protein [bacterium]